MVDSGLGVSPLLFLSGALCSIALSGWLVPGISSPAPAHAAPGPAIGQREAGVREATGRLEDSVGQCCAVHAAEPPSVDCRCVHGDTLGDLLRGSALGAGSLVFAAATWACRCCALIGRALPSAGRPASRERLEEQPAAEGVCPAGTAVPPPKKRRAGRGGALSHLAVETAQLK